MKDDRTTTSAAQGEERDESASGRWRIMIFVTPWLITAFLLGTRLTGERAGESDGDRGTPRPEAIRAEKDEFWKELTFLVGDTSVQAKESVADPHELCPIESAPEPGVHFAIKWDPAKKAFVYDNHGLPEPSYECFSTHMGFTR
jgi:hypothetical protein